jgi:hypothetical protein
MRFPSPLLFALGVVLVSLTEAATTRRPTPPASQACSRTANGRNLQCLDADTFIAEAKKKIKGSNCFAYLPSTTGYFFKDNQAVGVNFAKCNDAGSCACARAKPCSDPTGKKCSAAFRCTSQTSEKKCFQVVACRGASQ